MDILSLLGITVFAATAATRPLPDAYRAPITNAQKPAYSFADMNSQADVLGAQTEKPAATPTIRSSPTPTPRQTKKSTVTIALLGDSMVDTLGPGVTYLRSTLKNIYPGTNIIIKNFGVGGKPITDGITRITNDYQYLGKSYTSLISSRPDLVVVESFAYNPIGNDQGAIDTYWLHLASVVDIIRAHLPQTKLVMAATIAPNRDHFGDGAPGLSFSTDDKQKRTATIKTYLETAIKFAKSEHLPLADVYHASMDSTGNGKLGYINSGDHIHYSDAGRRLFGTLVAQTITKNRLLE